MRDHFIDGAHCTRTTARTIQAKTICIFILCGSAVYRLHNIVSQTKMRIESNQIEVEMENVQRMLYFKMNQLKSLPF